MVGELCARSEHATCVWVLFAVCLLVSCAFPMVVMKRIDLHLSVYQ